MPVNVAAGLEGFDLFDDWLTSFEAQITLACYQALYESTEDIQTAARETTSYNDDTGATRNSTFAYVFEADGDVPLELFEAVEIANAYRNFSASDDSHPSFDGLPPDSMGIDVMSATDYSHFLNTRSANLGAYLELAMLENVRHIMARIVANAKEVLE